jgi:predicted DNA-binding transcriptional regulator AlpA
VQAEHPTNGKEVNVATRIPPRTPSPRQDEWLTVDEVCAELKISRRTFDRWRALGTGPRSKHIGGSGPLRVRRSWLNEWLDTPDQDTA